MSITEVQVPFCVQISNVASGTMSLSPCSLLGTKSTQKTIRSRLKRALSIDVSNLKLRARSSSSGSEKDIGHFKDTPVEAFLQESGVIIVDAAPPLQAADLWEQRFDKLATSQQQLFKSQQKLFESQQQLRKSQQQLSAEVGVLRAGVKSFSAILRCSLVDDVHRKLQELPDGLGFRHEDELWTDYIERIISERGIQWARNKGLSLSSMVLLGKGSGSPFQEGSEAAHRLRLINRELFDSCYLSDLSTEEKAPWQELYKFVKEVSPTLALTIPIRLHLAKSMLDIAIKSPMAKLLGCYPTPRVIVTDKQIV
ncbi:hypothetical protein VOLCADRAFT_103198 [Volvox carteri f. nagariensis]|uniref:Uncharacterized protein n=1 Tax=Volvox carteri f. nagariensis TaxID=3068 RepID=D8TK43_VOLCA|nr:uncharacterized protein VOLCADRAFT_103198 [Volvox carteri f. nagariensis]EFJ51998.1 hypothetical protein VOLCADRAFT_103198 [Volvox carteri f. nagariensis]|eukprot:XP_002946772.1 hypothetical protein VOLCADRAFT_103198 [Volvox carteri f. nagariensis]